MVVLATSIILASNFIFYYDNCWFKNAKNEKRNIYNFICLLSSFLFNSNKTEYTIMINKFLFYICFNASSLTADGKRACTYEKYMKWFHHFQWQLVMYIRLPTTSNKYAYLRQYGEGKLTSAASWGIFCHLSPLVFMTSSSAVGPQTF